MASLSFSLSPSIITTTTTTNSRSSTSINPLLTKPSQLLVFRCNQARRVVAPKISCNVAKNDDQQTPKEKEKPNVETNTFDRRNMLIGLGGLYGAATTLSGGPAALAKPTAPDVLHCGPSELENDLSLDCCPPKPSQFVDFKLPKTNPRGLRIRPAAHLVDDEYIEKYSKALSLMKALPKNDPRSFAQQAKVHCAYCNGGYQQAGLPDLDLQIHGSWLFFPFHRAYLYFYEQILAKLIDDPTFAIPYWNWDHPDGMSMPAMFNIPNSPFLNRNRDPTHLHPTTLDLTYDGTQEEEKTPIDDQIAQNLTIMYKQMVANAKTPAMFLGDAYRAGDDSTPGPGSMEIQPHGTIHNWVGNPSNPLKEDMGNFYSAGRDPIFYSHHANVDRSWSIWRTLEPRNKDFKDKDFLNSYFYFYDADAKPVKIKVRDCLSTKKMGYDYQPMDMPWLRSRPTRPAGSGQSRGRGRGRGRGPLKKVFSNVKDAVSEEIDETPSVTFPKPLNQVIRTNLVRPQTARSKREKDVEEEVLIIEIELKRDVYSKFDVYVNDEDERPTKENRTKTEYAGSFVNVPHKGKHDAEGNMMTTNVKFGLTELMEDLGADDDEGIDVVFVPRTGTESMIIKDARIEFLN